MMIFKSTHHNTLSTSTRAVTLLLIPLLKSKGIRTVCRSFHCDQYTAGFVLVARYSYSSSLRFFVVANLVGSAFSLLPLLYLVKRRTRSLYIPPPQHYAFFLFFHDSVITAILLAGCSAATAIGLVAENGVASSGWMPICNRFHRFCNVGAVSLALSYSSFLSFFILTILSAAMSKHVEEL